MEVDWDGPGGVKSEDNDAQKCGVFLQRVRNLILAQEDDGGDGDDDEVAVLPSKFDVVNDFDDTSRRTVASMFVWRRNIESLCSATTL